jgi:uncharacterized membrane protein YeaQ/YmgE (transglycosylase-associated protein family)
MRLRKAGAAMSIVSWIAIGGLVGVVVERLDRGHFPGGRRGAAATGIAGALLGGGVFAVLDGRSVTALDPVTIVSALVGAVLVLAAMHEADRTEPRPH